MTRYRKKPVVVEAVQWMGNNPQEIIEFCGVEASVVPALPYIIIMTLEGDMRCEQGDYIIKGVAGEFYPCKPHIFVETYEVA